MTWNINLNTPARSLKGVLLLLEDPARSGMGPDFGRNSEFYYNPCITKVQVTVEGISNQLYAQGMLPYQHWDEIVKGFACLQELINRHVNILPKPVCSLARFPEQ